MLACALLLFALGLWLGLPRAFDARVLRRRPMLTSTRLLHMMRQRREAK